ncbi:MAG TPA: dihydrofolate reductase family protein [Candidatus Saccharimonadia bacterium]|nr:dihydrofolate reductase family protein [Candidatus Saccharimonadia bacterium]
MRKIIIQEFITMDGVMQAPGGAEEDASGSFKYGGWTAPYFREADDAAADFMKEWMRSTDILLGKTTYEIFADFWPEHEAMWPGINDVTKYVVSDVPMELTWQNSELITGDDVVTQLKRLKASEGSDIKVHGSSKVAQTLFENGLVDELSLMTFPVVLGTGKRLFAEGSASGAFSLVDSVVTPNGVICAHYKRAGEVELGTVEA